MPCTVNLSNDLASSAALSSAVGFHWNARYLTGLGPTIRSICYGKGRFVAVIQDVIANQVYTSEDGVTWTPRVAAAALQWQSVCFGGGQFVAVAQNGAGNQVMASPDGITWTSRAEAVTRQWMAVTWGNGLFVAVAADGAGDQVMTSANGILWVTRAEAVTRTWQSVCFGGGLFVAVSEDGLGDQVMTSANGILWVTRVEAVTDQWEDICWGDGYFLAVCTTAQMYSTDGIAWNDCTLPVGTPSACCYGLGKFYSVGANPATGYTSVTISRHPDEPDTVVGNYVIAGVGTGICGVAIGADRIVAVGDNDFLMAA